MQRLQAISQEDFEQSITVNAAPQKSDAALISLEDDNDSNRPQVPPRPRPLGQVFLPPPPVPARPTKSVSPRPRRTDEDLIKF